MQREHIILREVVEGHIDTGEAVGSKTVASRLRNRLSSASIRNVMSELCDRGLLAKPHLSSGRVPTDLGYRTYLDEILVVAGRLTPGPSAVTSSIDWIDGVSALEVMREAAHTVADRAGVAGLVFAPRLETAVLQRVELVWLGRGRVLAIAVTRGGLVHERLLRVGDALRREDLEGLTNYLNTLLPGRTLSEVRAVMEAEQRRDEAAHGELESAALELGRRAFEGADTASVVVDGAARILEAKEFAEAPDKAAELLRVIEQRVLWLELLDRVAATDDTEVYVGREARVAALEPCAVVASPFRSAGGTGFIVLVGPKRLDYRRAIPLVGVVARQLSRALQGREDDAEELR